MEDLLFNFPEDMNNREISDIRRNLNNLFKISEGTIPLIRGLGLSISNVSKIPINLENDIVTDIVAKVDTYESRVSVASVEFEHTQDGETKIKIYLEKGENSGT